MRGFEEAQPAVLHEGNAAAGELELQLRAVAGAAEQHRLRLQRHAPFASFQHALGDAARLVAFVADADELRPRGRRAIGPEVLGEAFAREADHGIGRVEDRLGRTVIAIERHHARGRREALRKVEDVAHRRRPERIDRLGVVADHRHTPPVRLHREQDRGLQPVGVLVLVDEHVVEARADLARERGFADHVRPVEQQVVVVEHVLRLLRVDVGAEQLGELGLPRDAPRIVVLEHLAERRLAIDRAGVDREARRLGREAALGGVETELVPRDRDQVFRIAAIEDREGLVEPDARRVLAQQARADAVERASPPKCGGALRSRSAEPQLQQLSRPTLHLGRCPAAEREQQDPLRVGTVSNQVRDAEGKRVGLAGSGAGDDQQRTGVARVRTRAVLDREPLLRVQRREEVGGVGSTVEHRHASNERSGEHSTGTDSHSEFGRRQW